MKNHLITKEFKIAQSFPINTIADFLFSKYHEHQTYMPLKMINCCQLPAYKNQRLKDEKFRSHFCDQLAKHQRGELY